MSRLLFFCCLIVCPLLVSSQQLQFSVYLVGDAGLPELKANGMHELLQDNETDSARSAVIFLGDNIYPDGMTAKTNVFRPDNEAAINGQVDAVSNFKCPVYFIPGNHDWRRGRKEGLEHLLNAQTYFDSLKNPSVVMMPRDGCPGPVEINIDSNLTFVFIDSQWFLHPFEKPYGDSSACTAKTPEEFIKALTVILEENKQKRIVIAAHHPVYTYGEHGGVFTFMDHIFPLRDIDHRLYLPLPIIGSLYPLYRKKFPHVQDTEHPVNKKYRNMMISVLEKYPGVVFASGHEHALQYIFKNGVHYVVSGSGVKRAEVKRKKYSRFASGKNGFARVDFFQDGSSSISFFETHRAGAVYMSPLPVK